MITHWIITSITWGVITYIIIRIAKKKYGFDIFASEGSEEKMNILHRPLVS